jgi:hypothetical protein
VWDWVAQLWGGSSRTVNTLNSNGSSAQKKLLGAYTAIKGSPMQVQLCGGPLAAAPRPPVATRGAVFYAVNGQTGDGTAPVIAAAGGGSCGPALMATSPLSETAARAAGLIGQDGTSVVAGGAGNIIAGGAGNVVAGGAGNIVATDGATVVAGGAGNVIAGGAGNIVAGGGGNVLATDTAAMFAAGQGSLMGDAGAGLIGHDGSSFGLVP